MVVFQAMFLTTITGDGGQTRLHHMFLITFRLRGTISFTPNTLTTFQSLYTSSFIAPLNHSLPSSRLSLCNKLPYEPGIHYTHYLPIFSFTSLIPHNPVAASCLKLAFITSVRRLLNHFNKLPSHLHSYRLSKRPQKNP